MAITKETQIGRIEVVGKYKSVQVRTDTVVIEDSVVLRADNSELLILPKHFSELKKLKSPEQFSTYFVKTALVNRSARKLFTAWIRKDDTIWPRLFKQIHKDPEKKS